MYKGSKLRNVYIRKTKITSIPSSIPHVTNIRETINNIFGGVNMHLWLHFIGSDFGCKRYENRYKSKFILSIALAFIAELIYLCYQIERLQLFTRKTYIFEKRELVLLAVFILELFLRILLYKNRYKLHVINRRLSKIYLKISQGNRINFKNKILLILLINDFVNIATVTYAITVNNLHISLDKIHTLALRMFWSWNEMTVVIPIYFCNYCFMLNTVLNEMKTHLTHKRNIDVHLFYDIYNKTSNLIHFIDEVFHGMLLITFTVLLGWIFHDVYKLTFSKVKTSTEMSFLILFPSLHFIHITVICLYASSVTKLSTKVKDLIFLLRSDVTPLVLKLQCKDSAFTLLDSIRIGKRLIISLIGSLITYGMLLATFNANTVENA